MRKGPYGSDCNSLPDSERVSGSDLLKYEFASKFSELLGQLDTDEVIARTGLDKSDVSRLRAGQVGRFSLNRLVDILKDLGVSTSVSFKDEAS